MEKAIEISRSFGYIKIPDDSIIQAEDIKLYRPNELVVICTGSQGEPMAALSRVAKGDHKDLKIVPGDTVVFSSSAIPGNGIMIRRVVNLLTRCGADVITNSILSDIHSSGHPSKQELRLMLRLVRPKYFMPIHGEYRMLKIHGEIAQSVGVPKENIFVLENGDSIILNKHKIVPGPSFPAEPVYIDGKNINGQKQSVIEDRAILQRDGLIAVIFGIDSKKGAITVPPSVITRAFISDDIHFYKSTTQTYAFVSLCILKSCTYVIFGYIAEFLKYISNSYVFV
jgi:ribonuclease J